MTLEEILEKLHSPTEHAITLENGELTALLEELKELRELREENKVLMLECERLIKEKGELLNKVSGGDVLRIGQLEEAKRLLKAAVEDIHKTYHHRDECCDICKNKQTCTINCAFVWQHEAEALKLIGGKEND